MQCNDYLNLVLVKCMLSKSDCCSMSFVIKMSSKNNKDYVT